MYSDGPVLTALTEDVTGDNGERIELACLVDSNPRPNITWTRPGHAQVRKYFTMFYNILKYSITSDPGHRSPTVGAVKPGDCRVLQLPRQHARLLSGLGLHLCPAASPALHPHRARDSGQLIYQNIFMFG